MKQLTLAAIMVTALAAPAHAQKPAADHSAHHLAPAQQAATLSDGEVRRVDKDANKLTIRHGPIPNLDMPPMTMVFQVKDPALLDTVTAGDKIKFSAEKIGGALTVTRIEMAR